MNKNTFLVLVLILLSGCTTSGSHRTFHPADCTSGAKRDGCQPAAIAGQQIQKKTVASAQSEQPIDRRARPAKFVEYKKINDENSKAKNETKNEAKNEMSPLVLDNTAVSKPDLKAQKKVEAEMRVKVFSASMDCVKNNIKKKDDGHSNVRAVAYELAVMCREKGVQVNLIANASIPLVLQNRVHKNTN